MSDRTVVTGASGFIGARLVATLRAAGTDVVALDHRWSSRADLEGLLGDAPVDRCIHAGWYASPGDYLTSVPENERSLRASLELVDALADRGATHLLVVGSSAEYAPSDEPIREDGRIDPWSCYGACKAALRLLLRSSRRPADVRVGWARVFNVTGPGEHPDRLVPWVTRSMLRGERVPLTLGDQVRDFLDVDDVADALAHLSRLAVEGDVNVASGAGISLRALLTRLAQTVDGARLLDFGARPRSIHDPDVVVGDNQRLRSLGYSPKYDLDTMIARVVEHWTQSGTRSRSS